MPTALIHLTQLCLLAQTTHAFMGIAEPRFKFEGLIDVGSLGIGKEGREGMIAAVGDIDGDQS